LGAVTEKRTEERRLIMEQNERHLDDNVNYNGLIAPRLGKQLLRQDDADMFENHITLLG
jgi:hypothetical protein